MRSDGSGMKTFEDRIKDVALDAGAALAGIASRAGLSDAPPSGNPGYLLPSARSVISFAVPFNENTLRDYFGKRSWRVFGNEQKRLLRILYGITDCLVDFLKGEGYEAVGVNINCTYRPEKDVHHFTGMTGFVPDFSHQYGALAAGLGRLGLSGNLLTPEHGAAVLLGTVLTSAVLDPDPPCEESPCDRCGLCILVCPVRMMERRGVQKSEIAGLTEEIAARRPHSCCWIGCGDYHGLSPEGTWSNWSPYRLGHPLPREKRELDALLIRLRRSDPESFAEPNPYTDYRAVSLDPEWQFSATCGNCANICWKERSDREENMRRVVDTGVVVLRADGSREATHDPVLEVDTQYSVRVAVPEAEYRSIRSGNIKAPAFKGHLEKDRKVLEFIYRDAKTER